MNLQKEDMTIKQVPERFTEEEDNPWTLGSQMRTLRTGSQSASIVTNMNTWQKSANWKRRNKKYEHVSNATRRDT